MENERTLRIALISPQVVGAKEQIRRTQPPMGLGYLAAVLEESGVKDILILDATIEDYDNVESFKDDLDLIKYGLSDEGVVKRLKDFNPDVVGVASLFSSQAVCALSVVKAIKATFPEVPVVLGGIHATIQHEHILENYPVDFILSGESDYTFKDLVGKLFRKEDYRDVEGLIWRDNGAIKVNPRSSFIHDMSVLPFPAWHLMPMEKYFELGMFHNPFVKSGRVGCIMTSRGCPQYCYFCSSADFFGHRFRPMSAERVVEMIGCLVDQFGIKELQILDDTFTLDYKRVIAICEGIKKFGLRITLPNGIRADVPKDHQNRLKMFRALRDAGCEQIGVSVEHGDQDFLNGVLCKRLDLNEAIATCELAHQADLLVHCNFMVGFPFEEEAQREETANFARKLQADSFSVSLATPLPGTKMWDIVEENGLFLDTFNINRVLYNEVSIRPADISPVELKKFVKNLNRELNAIAAKRSPASKEKYKLFAGKTAHGDRKYQFSEKKI